MDAFIVCWTHTDADGDTVSLQSHQADNPDLRLLHAEDSSDGESAAVWLDRAAGVRLRAALDVWLGP